MKWLVVIAFVPSLLVAWLAGFAVRRWAPRWGLFDKPDGRKAHSAPTPLGGGLAIAVGVLLPLAVGSLPLWYWNYDSRPYLSPTLYEWLGDTWFTQAVVLLEPHLPGLYAKLPDLWLLLGAATLLLVLGLQDDLGGLDWRVRLAAQTALVAGLIVGRGWQVAFAGDWPLLSAGLTLVWVVGLVNSFNMLDNMDGLAAGVAAIAAVSLAILLLVPAAAESGLAPLVPRLFIAGLSLALFGAILGFLWHNRPPARLFMGDAGSYFIGFLLAMLLVLAGRAGDDRPGHPVLAALCLMGVPIYDTVSVVLIRLCAGKSPFVADRNHLSHRLVRRGLTSRQAVLVICAATAVCGIAAVVLNRQSAAGAAATLCGIGALFLATALLEISTRNPNVRP